MKRRLAEALVFHFSYFPFEKWGTGSVRDIKVAEGGPGSLYSLLHLHKSFPYLTPSDWLALSFKCPSALCGFPRTTVKWSLLLRIISSICCESLAVCSEGRPTWWWPGATRKGRVPATRVPTSSSSSWNIDAPFLSLPLSLFSQMTLSVTAYLFMHPGEGRASCARFIKTGIFLWNKNISIFWLRDGDWLIYDGVMGTKNLFNKTNAK